MTNEEHRSRIRRLRQPGLLRLWAQIKANAMIAGFDQGRAFEYMVLRAFELEGVEVDWPFSARLSELVGLPTSPNLEAEQIDGVVYQDGVACLMQMKDEGNSINIDSIAKLRNQLMRRPAATIGCLFTARTDFTMSAKFLARFLAPQTVLLWQPAEIEYALGRGLMSQGLKWKYRAAVQKGIPDYDVMEGHEHALRNPR